jgi:hypothetical protein
MRWLVVAALSVGLVLPRPAAAQSASRDPLPSAYQRLYAGNADAAYGAFSAARTQNAQALPAWFGQLLAQLARLQADESLEAGFERDADAFIAAAAARYSQSRDDTEALFYLAQAHMLRGAFRASSDKGMWGAARDAARSKSYAEQYLKVHPEHGDAYFSIGLYNYYVGIAPTFLKVLRVLLFLPGGDRATGLRQIERAAKSGQLFAPMAEAILGSIYGGLEGRLSDGIAIGERLTAQFPGNALMRISLAQLYAHPTIEDYTRAELQYRAILDRATSSSLQDQSDRQRATLELAQLRRTQWRLDEAIALLTPVIDSNPAKPEWIQPTFLLQRASFRMLVNDSGAMDDVTRVLRDARWAKWQDEARETRSQIGKWRARASDAAIYASLIPANRLVVADRWEEARAAYAAVESVHKGDWQVRYRLAYLEFARGNDRGAATALEGIANSSARIPDWLRANAMLTLAWTRDIAGRREEALTLYRRIVADYEDESASGPARLGLLAPYKRHNRHGSESHPTG